MQNLLLLQSIKESAELVAQRLKKDLIYAKEIRRLFKFVQHFILDQSKEQVSQVSQLKFHRWLHHYTLNKLKMAELVVKETLSLNDKNKED